MKQEELTLAFEATARHITEPHVIDPSMLPKHGEGVQDVRGPHTSCSETLRLSSRAFHFETCILHTGCRVVTHDARTNVSSNVSSPR